MKSLTLALCAALAAGPATAPAYAQDDNGTSRMKEGLRLFLEGLQQEVEPTMQDLKTLTEEMGPAMRDFFVEMGPALSDLAGKVEDWSVYEPPEILPNGDIILRRKPEPTPDAATPEADEGQIDL